MKRRGFTLVEMLITTSLMTLVAGVLMAVLSGGLRVWQRARDYGIGEQASLVAFDGMRRDFDNSRRFTLVPFKGEYDDVAFAFAETAAPGSGDPAEIGRLAYFLDERRHLLCRSFVPYRLAGHIYPRDRCQAVLRDVRRLRFEYFGEPEPGHGAGWSQHWDAAALPLAVKVSAELQEAGQRTAARSFVVYLNHDLKTDDEKS